MLPYNAMMDIYVKEFNLNRQVLDRLLHRPSRCVPGFMSNKQKFILDAIAIKQTQKVVTQTAIHLAQMLYSENGEQIPDMNDSYIPYAIEQYFQEIATA